MSDYRIEILLATYQSERFLEPLLESLAAQTEDDFHLVVADDGSTDATLSILEAWRPRFRNPVTIRHRAPATGSAMANFSTLLTEATGDYVLLADHDDLWAPYKVARQVAQLRRSEALAGGTGVPILTHSDLRVVDGAGRETAPSYWAWKEIEPAAGTRVTSGLMHATVTGCAVAMNRALVRRAVPVPQAAIMHDWWLALVAAAFGRLEWDPEPLTAYRIHGANASRPRRVALAAAPMQINRLKRIRFNIQRRYAQGAVFYDRYAGALPSSVQADILAFLRATKAGPVSRQMRLVRGGFLWPGVWRNLVQMTFA